MRRTDTALSIGYDILVGCHAYLGEHFVQFRRRLEQAMPVLGDEVEPLQMDRARNSARARVAAAVGAIPLAIGSDVEEDRIIIADVGDSVVERAYQRVVGLRCERDAARVRGAVNRGRSALVEPLLPAPVQDLDVGVSVVVEDPPEARGVEAAGVVV